MPGLGKQPKTLNNINLGVNIIDTQENVTTNKTTDKAKGYFIGSNGGFNISSGITLTIASKLNIQLNKQIFFGEGDVIFENNTIDEINIMWFGANPNDENFDNQPAIQKAIKAALDSKGISKIKFPVGDFYISNPILCYLENEFFNISFKGSIMPYNNPTKGVVNGGYGGVTVIKSLNNIPFMLGLQGTRGVSVKNIVFDGYRTADIEILDLIEKTTTQLGTQLQYAPNCGIVIDPFGTVIPPDGGYVDFASYYNSNAKNSSKIKMENCVVQNFDNGIVVTPNSTGQQADSISIDNVRFDNMINGIIVGQSQSRRISFTNCDMHRLKYCFNTYQYGKGQGIFPEVINLKIADGCAWIFNHKGSTSFIHLVNVYTEALYGIGYTPANNYPLTLTNCTLKFSPYTQTDKININPCILKASTFSMINSSLTIGGGSTHEEPLIMDVEEIIYLNSYLDANIVNIGKSISSHNINTHLQTKFRKDSNLWDQGKMNASTNRTISYDTNTGIYSFIADIANPYTTNDFVFGLTAIDNLPFESAEIYTVFGKVLSYDSGTGATTFKSNLLPTDGINFDKKIVDSLISTNSNSIVNSSINIGSWNMGSATTKNINHNLSATEWLTVTEIAIIIFNDSDFATRRAFMLSKDGFVEINETQFSLERTLNGFFDTGEFNQSGGERGTINFKYTPD